ncbi:MAG TPA: hypothetical protein VFZ38_10625 [Vicinamibacterales bacterium]
MSKSNTFETEILSLFFLNTNIANIGDATGLRGSTTVGSVFASLHTADPGEAGTAATNEISYTGYARQAIPRNGTNFSVANGVVTQLLNIDFPEMTGGTGGTVTHFAYVKEVSGASVILYKGPYTPNQVINTGVIPRLKGNASGAPTTVTED